MSLTDAPPRERYRSPELHRGSVCRSFHLAMRDGVRLAADLYLAADLAPGRRVPCILHQTRYFRSVELRWPLRLLAGGRPFDHSFGLNGRPRRRFVEAGYAWLDLDVRGTGASFGRQICPWSPDEIRDAGEVVDWIVAQPWSSGRVGALGVSYDGTAAEMLLLNRHPAVRAVAPEFSLFDIYADVAFPGGARASWFLARWRDFNAALDRNAPHEVAGWWTRLVTTGVTPVDGDGGGRERDLAAAAHAANYDVRAEAERLVFRDDVSPSDGYHVAEGAPMELLAAPADDAGSIGLFSPHSYARALEASGAAILSYSGWLDGGYAHAAIKRQLAVRAPGSRLLIGPWNHGGGWDISDPLRRRATRFDHEGELLRFFDHHLKGLATGIEREPPVRYFVIGAGWRAGEGWPPPARPLVLFLGARRELDARPPGEAGVDHYQIDFGVGSGVRSRWRTQVEVDKPVLYADRAGLERRLLVYRGAPLAEPIEVAGHPLLTLHVVCPASDALFFAYLEDEDPAGRVRYVTDGLLRALHRRLARAPARPLELPARSFKRADALPLVPGEAAELCFDLLPTAYRFAAGHRVRLALAGADRDHFAPLAGGATSFSVLRGGERPSRLELPLTDAPY